MKTGVYSGSGNTFLLIDNRNGSFTPSTTEIRTLSKDKDGVVLLETSPNTDLAMRIFNADGSEAEMCGNGARCLLTFYRNLTGFLGNVTLSTKAGLVKGCIKKETVSVFLSPPKDLKLNILLPDIKHPLYFLNTGVPHALFFVTDLEKDPLIKRGYELRHHPFFGEKGSNINFIQIHSNHLKIRTFERGLEHESPACGTGVCAAAFIAIHQFQMPETLTLIPKSQDPLMVTYDKVLGFELQGNVYFT